jgi:hypothetical protein
MSRLSGFYAEHVTPSAWATVITNRSESADFSVPGARVGDFVWCSIEFDAGDITEGHIVGTVTADDTVSIAYFPDDGTTGPGTGTQMRIKVVPFGAI